MQVGEERGTFPLNTSMDEKMESEPSSSLTSNQLAGALGAIAHAAAGLALVKGEKKEVHTLGYVLGDM